MDNIIKEIIKADIKKDNSLMMVYTVCNDIAIIYNNDIHSTYNKTDLEQALKDYEMVKISLYIERALKDYEMEKIFL